MSFLLPRNGAAIRDFRFGAELSFLGIYIMFFDRRVKNQILIDSYITPEINCLCVSVSENKVLCHPSSVDSLSTSAGTEDHVSMGGFSARKALMVVEHVEIGTSRTYQADNRLCYISP